MFAPLARLLGLYSIKEELEALSFMYSDPESYAVVQRRLDVLAKMQGDVVLAVSFFGWASLKVTTLRLGELHSGAAAAGCPG